MEFIIEDRVFDILPHVCFGVVVAKGINNHGQNDGILRLLDESIQLTVKKFGGTNIKEHPDILCYREAFKKLRLNPNKFPCSVEAMTARVLKGGRLPAINNVVNLINAVSLKYTLPMGAHDLKWVNGNLKVCFSKGGEPFVPFGQSEPEYVEEGELVYADDRAVKTRRWIWRQSEIGKITEDSTDIFIPIDGFIDYNNDAVLRARDELSEYFREFFNVEPEVFFLHAGNRSVKIM
jgi:DNA/RNA-binding domain of Phe-tRNA-synthetase-like protein